MRLMDAREVRFATDGATLAGTLTLTSSGGSPGVLLLGGTFSDLRDGDADPDHRPDIPPHGMYRLLAESLTRAGFAVLRFDRRGSGASSGRRPDRATEIRDAHAAWSWLDTQDTVAGAAAMVGESAGAYVACRLMAECVQPSAVVLQGALHRSIAGLIEFNADRARAWYDRGEAERSWMREHAPREYASATLDPELVAVIRRGEQTVAVQALAYDIEYAPEDQFEYVTCPVLVLHGADDLNVPVEDAFATCSTLWAAGNRHVELRVLAEADHSMQQTPADADDRIRERMSMQSFRRPFHPEYPEVITEFLTRILRLA